MGNSGLTALLFSGGLDSVALAYWKRPDLLLTIDYGQVTAEGEIRASGYFAREIGLPWEVIKADLSCVGGGSLARSSGVDNSAHPEWWPFRNQLLITMGASWGIPRGVSKLLMGSVKSDECFADGRQPFFKAMNNLLAVQEGQIEVEAPACLLDSRELLRASGVPLGMISMCFSCNVSIRPCGFCRSCVKLREILTDTGQM